VITTSPAPQPLEQTDTNPRCDRCKCSAHQGQKCTRRACGCRIHRDPRGSLTALGCVLVLALLAVLLIAAGLIGDHLRCQRLTDAHSPLTNTYCSNGDHQ